MRPITDTYALSNDAFRVEWSAENGGLKSLVLFDRPEMNWIGGTGTYGTIRVFSPRLDFPTQQDDYFHPILMSFEGLYEDDGEIVSLYRDDALTARVSRRLEGNALVERYEFTNEGFMPRYFLRGHIGIVTCFNDSYDSAPVCESARCHAHVFAQGENAYVHAIAMAPHATDIVLEMTQGALDGYSVRRKKMQWSNDRGDILLHPAPFALCRGQSRAFEWRVSARPAGTFTPKTRVKFETCFIGETFEITDESGTHRVRAEERGEFSACGARLFTAEPVETICEKSARHIVRNKQCRDEGSPLDGAFLVWDREERLRYFDERFRDHNASRERLGMGLFLARWLLTHDDPEIREGLERFKTFAFREFIDLESGAVYDTIGMDPTNKRLYNAPWAVDFLTALYDLEGKRAYLEAAQRMLKDYYQNGGARFYPNGCNFARSISLMEKEGLDARTVRSLHREHVANIIANGLNYPPHEVNYEQTIVSPAAAILLNYYLYLEKDPVVLSEAEKHLSLLVRFDGDQPDHRTHGMPIRHWDGYWFGKERLYADTVHYWSVLSGNAYALYWRATGRDEWRLRAEKCFRNELYLYHADGSGSAAYYLPYSSTFIDENDRDLSFARRGEKFDAFDNDQFTGLYFLLGNLDVFKD